MGGFIEIGMIIKEIRTKKGLSRRKLLNSIAKDSYICSEKELMRIENGKVQPTLYVFKRLMVALSEDPNKYLYHYANISDKQTLELITQINDNMRQRNFDIVKNMLDELDRLKAMDSKNKLLKLFLLKSKAILANESESNPQKAIDLSIEALRQTIPAFEIEKIEDFIFIQEEILTLNALAIFFHKIGSIKTAITILQKVRNNLENRNAIHTYGIRLYLMLLRNLSNYLNDIHEYAESAKITDEAIDVSRKNMEYGLIPDFYYVKASNLYHCNKIIEAENLFARCKKLYEEYGNEKMAAFVKSSAKDNYGFNLD